MSKSYKYSRSRKAISLSDAKLRLTDCIKELEKVILNGDYDPKEIHTKIQASYAMSNVINRYTKLVEITDLEQRVAELERKTVKQ
ncbi:MAG TPA: hypothetical protein VJ964_08980 [Balneolaceae bacterium]|nr:hypothetical protein [Balneolaceae bacterium]